MTSKESETFNLILLCTAAFGASLAIGYGVGVFIKTVWGSEISQATGEAKQCWARYWGKNEYQAITDTRPTLLQVQA